MTPTLDNIISSALWFLRYLGLPVLSGAVAHYYFTGSPRKKLNTLQNKVVLITGASSGLGEALAHVCYTNGAHVILAARRKDELERVKTVLLGLEVVNQNEPIVLPLDLSNLQSLDRAIEEAYEKCDHIDILINNGGISSRGTVLDTSIDVHKQVMDVNHFGPIALTKAVLPKMVERKLGHVAFVSSVQGRFAIPDRSAYAASKHACQAFADSLRAEVAKHNINVSVISPGYIKTALSLNALSGNGGKHGVMDATTASGYSAQYVAQRTLQTIVHNDKELVLAPLMPKLALMLRYLLPGLYFWIMAKRAK